MKNESKLSRKSIVQMAIIFVVLLLITVIIFGITYQNLRETLQQERTEYVTELTTQVVAKVNATMDRNMDEIKNNANLLNLFQPSTFEEAKSLFRNQNENLKDSDRIVLVSDQGQCYLLDGNTVQIADTTFLVSVSNKGQVTSTFSRITTYGDYWIYGSPVESIELNGIHMVAVLHCFSSAQYSKEMTVEMFESRTSSFLVSKTGDILVMPENAKGYGSNIVNSLVSKGIDDETANKIREDLLTQELTTENFEIDEKQWLMQTSIVRDGYSVVVLLPLQITASATVSSVNQLIMLVIVLLTVTLFSMMLVVIRYQKSASDKALQQEKYKNDLVMQAAANKSEFLAKMSHDIRTPLNGIIGMAYLAEQNIENRYELEDSISKIQVSADYLLSLVNDILDMSKIESGKMELHPEPINVEDVYQDISVQFKEQLEKKKITLSLHGVEKQPYSYLCDKLRIRQIIMNLVSNAVKFTPTAGTIDLSLEVMPGEEGTDQITFTIADNGEGMSEEFMQRIFTPFEQASKSTAQKHGGSGLGLAIVRSIVELMKGTVSVESAPQEGSRFVVCIPMERKDKIADKKVASEQKVSEPRTSVDTPFHGEYILLVEDHPINAQIAMKVLARWGLNVILAENGQLGLDAFCHSPQGYFSMVFMDIQMPVMDGYECVKNIRASNHPDAASIPIYAMSANAFDEDVDKSVLVGMNGHLKKPLEIEKVRMVLESHLKEETK